MISHSPALRLDLRELDVFSPTPPSPCPFFFLSFSQLLERFGQDIPGHLHPNSAGCPEDQSQNHRHCWDTLHIQGPALQVRTTGSECFTRCLNWFSFLLLTHSLQKKFPLYISSCTLWHSLRRCCAQQQWLSCRPLLTMTDRKLSAGGPVMSRYRKCFYPI